MHRPTSWPSRACIAWLALLPGSASALELQPIKDVAATGFGLTATLGKTATTSTHVFFVGNTNFTDREPWASDGTEAGTVLLVDSIPGANESRPHDFVAVGERAYFVARRATLPHTPYEWTLYESDGTVAGTRPVPFAGTDPQQTFPALLTPWNGELWLHNDGAIWKLDGAGATPSRVTTFGASRTYREGERFAILGDALLVPGRSCSTCLDEPERLWRIGRDGSKAPVAGMPAIGGDSALSWIDVRVNGSLSVAWAGGVLWRVLADGSASSIANLPTQPAPPRFLGPWGARIVFAATFGSRPQVWVTDGTAQGTKMVTAETESDEEDLSYASLGEQALLGLDPLGDAEGDFVRLDLSRARGFAQVRPIGAFPGSGANYKGRRFMAAYPDVGIDAYLWFSDGTPAGTREVDLEALGVAGGATSIRILGVVGDWLYLGIQARDTGMDLWRLRASQADLGPVPTADVVEFYRASRDTYFLTGLANEIALLDNGQLPGWARTGRGFVAYAPFAGSEASKPVCRFYGLPAAGIDSHFYSAYATECDAIATQWPGAWQLETDSIFEVPVPAPDGSCPVGFTQVYRNYNGRADVNHRYTTNLADRETMIQRGWVSEGFGPKGVAMCALSVDPAGPGGQP